MDARSAPKIGRTIKRARERKRMSQAEAAVALGVSRSALNAWENDRAYPRSSIGAIEELYGIVIDEPEPEPQVDVLAERWGRDDAERVRRILGTRGEAGADLIREMEEEFSPKTRAEGEVSEPGRAAAG